MLKWIAAGRAGTISGRDPQPWAAVPQSIAAIPRPLHFAGFPMSPSSPRSPGMRTHCWCTLPDHAANTSPTTRKTSGGPGAFLRATRQRHR